MNKTGSKISGMNGLFLILVALLFDGIQIFLTLIIIGAVLNWIVSLFAMMTFYVWLKLLGVSYWEGNGTRKLLSFIGCGFLEVVPIFNAFLGWTVFVVLIILFESTQSIPVFGQVARLSSGKKANQGLIMRKKIKTLIGIVIVLSVPFGALAASFTSQADLSLSVSPEFPRPGANIKVEARSYVFDALRANLQWYLNGKVVASGRGVTEQIFIATKVGTTMNIRVDAISIDGVSYTTSASIPISDIDLIARADTYAPRGYRGASLPTPGSVLEIYAVPYLYSGGAKLSAKNLIYEWSINGEKIAGASGGGKTKLAVSLPNFGGAEHEISLKISNLSGSVATERSIKVLARNPEVVFYQTDSLMGRAPTALYNFLMPVGGAFSIIAEPYFMAMGSLLKSRVIWKANGQDITQASEAPRVLDISAPQESSGGSTNFSFSIEDAKKLFQRATGVLTISSQ